MGNTPSSNTNSTNSHANLYSQYINEQKRIIAAQQEQINNLAKMNLSQNTPQHNVPSNIMLQQMNTNQNNMMQPVGSMNNMNTPQRMADDVELCVRNLIDIYVELCI